MKWSGDEPGEKEQTHERCQDASVSHSDPPCPEGRPVREHHIVPSTLVSEVPLASHPAVILLAGLSKQESGEAAELIKEIVRHANPKFDIRSPEGERIARAELRRQCERYLAGEIRPYDLCRLVTPIEHLFNFPDWLGDLYKACDWIEPETPREEVPHLEEEVRGRWCRALGAAK